MTLGVDTRCSFPLSREELLVLKNVLNESKFRVTLSTEFSGNPRIGNWIPTLWELHLWGVEVESTWVRLRRLRHLRLLPVSA